MQSAYEPEFGLFHCRLSCAELLLLLTDDT